MSRTTKHLAMSYRIRDHFIEIKNRYFAERDADRVLNNDPDYVIARALKMAE